MIKPLFYILLILSMPLLKVHAQVSVERNISGKIIDEDRKPFSFVSVLLKNSSDSTIVKTTLSDDNGMFVFQSLKPGSYFLEFRMMGYETHTKKDISIGEGAAIVRLDEIALTPSSKMLSEVVIKADVPFIERRADKIIVNLNEGLTAGASIMEVMDKLPGVRVSMQDQISLNGKGITVYIDGRITPLSGEALASFLKGMSSSNIEKVELITNPSSKYDAAGSGGIINIIRKKNTTEGLIGSLFGGYQQARYGRHSGGLTLNVKNKVYNFFFSTNYAYTKYFIDSKSSYNNYAASNTFLGQSQFNAFSTRDNRVLTPSIGFDFYLAKKTTLSVSSTESLTGYNKLGTTLFVDSDEAQLQNRRLDMVNNAKARLNSNISNVHLLHKFDSLGKEITADLDYSYYGNNTNLDNADKLYDAENNFVSGKNDLLDADSKIRMYALKADYTNPIDKLTNLEFGLKASYVDSDNANLFFNMLSGVKTPDNASTDNFKYTENINALYLNFNKKYKKLSFQMGLRGEHTLGRGRQAQTQTEFTNQYTKLFPSMSFDYKLNNTHGLTLNFNKRINRPSYENLNPLLRIINSTTYTQGNPRLSPVVSYNSSLSYSYKNEFFIHLHYDLGLREVITTTSFDPGAGTFTSQPGNNKYSNYFRAFIIYSKRLKPWWLTSNSIQVFQQQYKSTVNGFALNSSGIPASDISSYQEFSIGKRLALMALLKYQSRFESRNRITEANFYSSGGVRLKVFGDRGSVSVQLVDMFASYNNRYTENSVLTKQVGENYFDTRVLYTNFTYNFGKGRVKSVNKGNASEEERTRTNVKEN